MHTNKIPHSVFCLCKLFIVEDMSDSDMFDSKQINGFSSPIVQHYFIQNCTGSKHSVVLCVSSVSRNGTVADFNF